MILTPKVNPLLFVRRLRSTHCFRIRAIRSKWKIRILDFLGLYQQFSVAFFRLNELIWRHSCRISLLTKHQNFLLTNQSDNEDWSLTEIKIIFRIIFKLNCKNFANKKVANNFYFIRSNQLCQRPSTDQRTIFTFIRDFTQKIWFWAKKFSSFVTRAK